VKHHIVFLDDEGIAPSVKLRKLPFAHTWQSYRFTQPQQLVPSTCANCPNCK